MQLDFVTTTAAFDALRGEWQQLESEAANDRQFFQGFAWNWCWWRCFGDDDNHRLRILTLREDGALRLVWPMVVQREGACRVMRPLGGELAQYADALVHPTLDGTLALRVAAAALASVVDVDVLSMPCMRADAVVHGVVADEDAVLVWETHAAHVDCGAQRDFDSWLAGRGSDVRQGQRRSTCAFEKLGTLSADTDERGVETDEFVELALSFKRAWLERRGLRGKTLEPRKTRSFLGALCTELRARDMLRLSTLRLDGRLIATGLSFAYRRRYYYYLDAFDPTLEYAAPAPLQSEHSLRWCFDNGISCYDMLPPDTPFKHSWSDASTPVRSWLRPLNARGAIYAQALRRQLRPRLQSARAPIPGGMQRWLGTPQLESA